MQQAESIVSGALSPTPNHPLVFDHPGDTLDGCASILNLLGRAIEEAYTGSEAMTPD